MVTERLRRSLSTLAGLAVVVGALAAIGLGLSGMDRALADMPSRHLHLTSPGPR